ncbi:DUF885 domain-containing protein [Enhygromyxa salina]|uniref:Lipoprotein n=1 Tax=Enhygromyxa salina TaxID=215803 RepID=A0A2S9Y3J5_9BACT|nr:DUF885 domain-containing protein [Enhygromyxa salina]PRP99669.1 hypothetical protein ENSA7_63090 [Enhygromyxa salina]
MTIDRRFAISVGCALACSLVWPLGCASVEPARPADPPPTADIAIGRALDPQQMLETLSVRFMTEYFAASPVSATSLGEHTHDHRWPDLSLDGRTEQTLAVTKMLDDAAAIPRTALGPDQRIELDTIRNKLELWRFADEVEQVWRSDPLAYSYLISAGLDDLVSREFAPLDERAASVAARLEALPALVDQAIANLSDPALIRRPQAEVAVGQLAGLRSLIEGEVPDRMADAAPALRERISAAGLPAIAAVERLRAHVEALVPQAEGRWRIGPEAFATKLALTLQTDLSAKELLSLARAEHQRVRADMQALARELYSAMYGAKALARHDKRGRESDPDELVREVLAALADDHPTPDGLRDAAEANLQRLDAFVREQQLVPIDEQEVLQVIWTPPHARGVAIAGLAAPAPLDAETPGLPSFYLVQPLPPGWSDDLRESFLREYNSFMLEILSIHEAIPGHFVQLYWGKRQPSKVRRVFDNGAFVEGWAVYTERVMVEAGYAGARPTSASQPKGVSAALWTVQRSDDLRAKAIRLHGLKFYLRTVTNAILDHEIHAGTMTREQALELMVERSFQERGEAEGKWVRAQVSSTQLSTYFVGATAWFRLREQAEQRAAAAGEAFDMLEFHAAALSHGAPPVHRLPELMGWE